MTLLLVDPPRVGLLEGAAHGLVSLASWVGKRRPNANIILLDWSRLPLCALGEAVVAVMGSEPTIVGITCTTATYQSALSVARAFKQISMGVVTVLGGHHATPEAEVILNAHRQVDVVVRGEGERPLLQLVDGLPLSAIEGISYRPDLGPILSTAAPVPLTTEELDSIATEFDGVNFDYGKFGRLTYVSARGCPLACRFCVVAQQAVRSRSIPQVVADIKRLVQAGFHRYSIEDNFFARSAVRTIDLCEALADLQASLPHHFTFDAQTRIESCTDSVVAAMAKAGCDELYLGMEAVVARQLTFLGKTLDPCRFLKLLTTKVLPSLFRHGIRANLNIQVGIPETTAAERYETLRCLREIGSAAHALSGTVVLYPHLSVIYPGTPHFYDALAMGRFSRDIFEALTEWEATQGPLLRWMSHRFAHGAGGLPIALLDPDALLDHRFVLLHDRIREVDEMVEAMTVIPGISVFDYSPELTGHTLRGVEYDKSDAISLPFSNSGDDRGLQSTRQWA